MGPVVTTVGKDSTHIMTSSPTQNFPKLETQHLHQISSHQMMAMESIQSDDKVYVDVLSKARESCYKTRDAFYACLEKESHKKPTEIASVGLLYPVECKKAREQYVNHCRPTWVKHFDRQYCSKKKVQRLLDNEGRRGPVSFSRSNDPGCDT